LKNEDVAIVKMDATNNDVSGPYEVRGFPTLYWAPKNSKDSPVRYEVSNSLSVHVQSRTGMQGLNSANMSSLYSVRALAILMETLSWFSSFLTGEC